METRHFWEEIFYSVIEDIHIHKIYQYEEIWRHQREKMSKIAPFLSDRTLKNKVRRAKKLSILLYYYISLCGYLNFPQKLLKIFKF